MNNLVGGGEIARVFDQIQPGVIPNILANKYPSSAMRQIWSPEGKIIAERLLWVAVMEAQAEAGLTIPTEHIDDYRNVIGVINFDSMTQKEEITGHDVKARIEEFDELAGHQDAHKALTSRDQTDNVEQLQIMLSLKLIRARMVAGISRLAVNAAQYALLPITGRSHLQPAQTTTFGKRLANHGEELMDAYWSMDDHIARYKLRGIKGPVGTQQDMLDLFDGDKEKVEALEAAIAQALGFTAVYNAVGQIYPRSRDNDSLHQLVHSIAPLSNFAKNTRLMAMLEQIRETTRSRVNSSAMPHKINPTLCERINGFYTVVGGYQNMMREIGGDQWLEGTVADSVVRRVALDNAFFATDGAHETFLNIMDDFQIYPGAIDAELRRNLPFLSSTKLLMAAVKAGMGREDAHAIIKEHSSAAIEAVRLHGALDYDLYGRLARDPAFPLDAAQIEAALDEPINLVGSAPEQVAKFVRQAEEIISTDPEAAAYKPKRAL